MITILTIIVFAVGGLIFPQMPIAGALLCMLAYFIAQIGS